MRVIHVKVFILLLLSLYAAATVLSRSFRGETNYFPLFSWKVFVDVYGPIEEFYTLRVLSFNGEELSSPIFFADAQQYLREKEKVELQELHELLRNLVKAIKEGRMEEANKIRQEVERSFLAEGVTYEIVKIKTKPLDFLQNREVLDLESFGTFSTRDD